MLFFSTTSIQHTVWLQDDANNSVAGDLGEPAASAGEIEESAENGGACEDLDSPICGEDLDSPTACPPSPVLSPSVDAPPCPKYVKPKAKSKVEKASPRSRPKAKAKASASRCKAKAKAKAKAIPTATAGSKVKAKARPKKSQTKDGKGKTKGQKKSELREDPVWKKLHSVSRHLFSSLGFQMLVVLFRYMWHTYVDNLLDELT